MHRIGLTIKRSSRYATVVQTCGCDAIEQHGRPRLLDADVDTAWIGIIHAQERDEEARRVDNGDVLGYDGLCLRLCRGDDGLRLRCCNVVALVLP